jgi:hypothetical protein
VRLAPLPQNTKAHDHYDSKLSAALPPVPYITFTQHEPDGSVKSESSEIVLVKSEPDVDGILTPPDDSYLNDIQKLLMVQLDSDLDVQVASVLDELTIHFARNANNDANENATTTTTNNELETNRAICNNAGGAVHIVKVIAGKISSCSAR